MKPRVCTLLFIVLFLEACAVSQVANRSVAISEASKKEELSAFLVFVEGVDYGSADAAYRSAGQYLQQQLNIKLVAKKTQKLRMTSKPKTPEAFLRRIKRVVALNQTKDYELILVFLPPRYQKVLTKSCARLKIRGFSEGIGTVWQGGNAFALMTIEGNAAYDTQTVLHEVGHLLGARHSDSGIMQTSLSFGIIEHWFSRVSIQEIESARYDSSSPNVCSAFASPLKEKEHFGFSSMLRNSPTSLSDKNEIKGDSKIFLLEH